MTRLLFRTARGAVPVRTGADTGSVTGIALEAGGHQYLAPGGDRQTLQCIPPGRQIATMAPVPVVQLVLTLTLVVVQSSDACKC